MPAVKATATILAVLDQIVHSHCEKDIGKHLSFKEIKCTLKCREGLMRKVENGGVTNSSNKGKEKYDPSRSRGT